MDIEQHQQQEAAGGGVVSCKRDDEDLAAKAKEALPDNPGDYVMPIGTYKGERLCDLSDEYLEWAGEHLTRPDVRAALQRYAGGKHEEDDDESVGYFGMGGDWFGPDPATLTFEQVTKMGTSTRTHLMYDLLHKTQRSACLLKDAEREEIHRTLAENGTPPYDEAYLLEGLSQYLNPFFNSLSIEEQYQCINHAARYAAHVYRRSVEIKREIDEKMELRRAAAPPAPPARFSPKPPPPLDDEPLVVTPTLPPLRTEGGQFVLLEPAPLSDLPATAYPDASLPPPAAHYTELARVS